MDITAEKNFQGAYVVSTIFKGYLRHKIYMGYTKKLAISKFKQYLKTL